MLTLISLAALALQAQAQECTLQRPKPLELSVKINGKGPFLFGFDSGQSVALLVSPSASRDLSLAIVGSVSASDGKNGGVDVPLAKVETVEFAGRTWKGVDALILAGSGQGAGPTIGTVGLPLFKDHLLRLDVFAGELTLSNAALKRDSEGVVPLRVGQGTPFVQVVLGGVSAEAHIDSGADKGIMIPTSMKERFKFKGEPKHVGKMATLFGESDIYEATLDGEARIGGLTVRDPQVMISDLLEFINVGRDVIGRAVVTIDQRNRLMKIVARAKT